jgi:membrane protein
MLKLDHLGMAFVRGIWATELSASTPWRTKLIRLLRGIYTLARDLAEGHLTLYATSLVYTTLLSLVPLLAVSFSVLKAFGVHNKIQPVLLRLLEPLGTKGVEITVQILVFVENIKVGVLGALGLVLLLYTVISLLQKIEVAFNYTWHVERSRPLIQRITQYLSVLTVGPVLVFSALGITATLMSSAFTQAIIATPFGHVIAAVTRVAPYLLIIMAFTFVYIFIPYTKVNFRSALFGGVIAGVLWQLTGWGFASFVVSSGRYTAVYSGFAILIMFMLWMYASWLILLVGASIAYYHQHPEQLAVRRRDLRLSSRVKERLALLLMALTGQRFYHNQPAWTTEDYAQHLQVPINMITRIIDALELYGLLARTADDPPRILPARPLETTPVLELVNVIRMAEEHHHLGAGQLPGHTQVDQMVARMEQALGASLHGLTLKDLLSAEDSHQRELSAARAAIRR